MKAPPVEGLSKKVKSRDVINAIEGVIKFTSENPKLQNTLFKEDFPLFLQVNCFKIPEKKGSIKQLYRIPLKNSPLPPDADVCLIVPDVKGIPNKEHERHLEHYETILNSKGVTGIKKVMTFHEFRTEYDTYELKNRLADLYDVFLVDGRISGKVVHKCGNIFYKKRKVPIAVKVHVPQLKTEIDRALKKAFFHMNFKSDSQTVQIGQSQMKVKHLAENVVSVIEFLDKEFPGKMENIRSLHVCAHRGSSIPIYLSLSKFFQLVILFLLIYYVAESKNEVEVPVIVGKKPVTFKLGQYAKELRAKRRKVNAYLGEKGEQIFGLFCIFLVI